MKPVDLLVLADRVLTPEVLADPASSEPGFVAVRDGRIVAVGAGHEAAAWADGAARVVDLGAGTLASGFIDAHIHPVIGLTFARGLDLSGISRRAEARAAIAAHVEGRDDEWILGWGLDPAVFEGGAWDNSLFDGLLDGRKAFFALFDGHAALVSEEALALAGVTGAETFPDASFVAVDDDGRPTGMLHEMQAEQLVIQHLPTRGFDERVDELGALFRGMAESGIVAGQMLDLADPDSIPLLEELERRDGLAIRLRISPWAMPSFTEDDLADLAALQGRAGRRWEVKGIKLMIDGTVDNGTAWLFEPDTKGESTESLYLDPEQYRRAVRYFHERGIPTTTHAIGDRGIAFAAEAIAEQPANGTRHRIEHIETLPDEVLDRIVEAGIATSMQPTHCTHYSKADHSDNWSQRLGHERANRAWRIGDLRARGATVALGSDWPIAPYDPRGIVAAAQLRRPAGRPDIAPVQPAQAISAVHAVEGYTSEYWSSVGESGGRIEVGARADLTAFADDPLTADPDVFAQTEVLLTVVDGEVVVDRTAEVR